MNYSSLRRVLFSSLSDPSWMWPPRSDYCLGSSLWTLGKVSRIELTLGRKGTTTAEGAFPIGLWIKLNNKRSHAGQRSQGHMTRHAAFQRPPHQVQWDHLTEWWRMRINAEISGMLCALLPIFSLQSSFYLYIYILFIYIYTVHLPCALMELHEGMTY